MHAYLDNGRLFAPVTFLAPGIEGDVWLEVPQDDPEYDMWLADAQNPDPWSEVASGWDESKHPRVPGGEGGGQFTESGGVAVQNAPVMGLGSQDRRARIEQNNDALPFGFDRFKKAEIEKGLKDFLDYADLSMRVPEQAMGEILNDGEFYNQHQSGQARGLERSTAGEANLLGLPDDTPMEQLPKYAYLGPDNSQVNMYGPLKVIFKDEVKDRTTFTVGDSLMTNAIPAPVRDPWWGQAQDSVEIDTIPTGEDWAEMVHEETGGIAYMEAQIYGKLTPDDIERVEVLSPDYWDETDPMNDMPMVMNKEQMGAVLDHMTELGIPWSEYTPEGDFSGEWA